MQNFRYETSTYLWEFAKRVAKEDCAGAAALQRPVNSYRSSGVIRDDNGLKMERYIGELAIDEEKSPLLTILNDMELVSLVEQLLSDCHRL